MSNMERQYYIYILTNKKYGTFYTGVTNDLTRRVYEHKNDLIEGFTKKYQTHILVYFEITSSIQEAIRREKQIKAWKRDWKINVIERENPGWNDLFSSLL
jgi:putative endonuclease